MYDGKKREENGVDEREVGEDLIVALFGGLYLSRAIVPPLSYINFTLSSYTSMHIIPEAPETLQVHTPFWMLSLLDA